MDGTDGFRWYPQLLRRPGVNFVQCAVSLAAMAFLVAVVQVGLVLLEVIVFGGFGSTMGVQEDGSYGGPVPVLYGVLLGIIHIGFACLAVVVAFGVHPGWLTSVAARPRWKVVLAVLSALPMAAGVTWVGTLVEGSRLVPAPGSAGSAGGSVGGWIAVAVLVAVVSAALDEFVFRGWLAQTAGALLPGPRAALALSGAASALGFTWWRSPDGPVELVCTLLLGLVLFALVTLTGGLEAAVAVAVGISLALVVPYAAVYGLDVASAPRAASWADLAAGVVGGAVAAVGARIVGARIVGAQRRGQPEGPARSLSDLSDLRGAR